MKEGPILFSGPMVKSILEGRKTQTCRVLKHPEYFACLTGDCGHSKQVDCDSAITDFANENPYGTIGDRLWVRETFALEPNCGDKVLYRADAEQKSFAWKPSIFMPRGASRITLEITGVRVERVQEIKTTNAIKEGIERVSRPEFGDFWWKNYGEKVLSNGKELHWFDPVRSYQSLWDSINGKKYPWVINPWVWVIEFRRVNAD